MEHAVFIGRFQPFHNAHLETVRFALKQAKKLIIVIGSAGGARNIKNPWSAAERIAMITACLSKEEQERVSFVCAKDYSYNNNLWLSALQSAFAEAAPDMDDAKTVLVGHKKDASSFYLSLFPQWQFIETGIRFEASLDATRVRENLFRQDALTLKTQVPAPVAEMLLEYMKTDEYRRLHEEWHHIEDYKAQWAGSPFPPTFNTVDAVVVCSGHVLLVRRKGAPGRGLLALPGGFINAHEELEDACVRELKEETSIRIPAAELKQRIEMEKTFGSPGRSLRGRTITHAYLINLGAGALPQVKGEDDADKAFWLPFREVMLREDQFFDDHWHMINFFVNRF
jgi:bifunctional NMN adenylyltransferase/nudix hydrolase